MIDIAAPIRDWMPTALYVGHRPGLPDVILGRWPADVRAAGAYKTWICETPAELAAVQAALARPVPRRGPALDFRAGPDRAVTSQAEGMEPRGSICVALYPPPEEGWPWLVLLCVPYIQPDTERGRYTWEAMPTEAAALDHLAKMARMLPPGSATILPPVTGQ